MRLEDGDDVGKDGYGAASGRCLGWPGEAVAARQLGDGLGHHPDLAGRQVGPVPAQRRQLAEAEPAPGRHEDHGPVQTRDRRSKCFDLGHRRERLLVYRLFRRALDLDWAAGDAAVAERGAQDRGHKAICLRCGSGHLA